MNELEKFRDYLLKCNESHIAANGFCTTEFSTSADNILGKMKIASECHLYTDKIEAVWVMFPCDKCTQDDPDHPIHVMLVDTRSQSDANKFQENQKLKGQIRDLKRELSDFDDKIIVDKDVMKVVVDKFFERNHGLPARNLPDEIMYLSYLVDSKKEKAENY